MIDAFSHRVIGWALDQTVEDELTLTALRMALEARRPSPGLVHHSDRGSQYASGDYTDLLKTHGCQISMSRKASPLGKWRLRNPRRGAGVTPSRRVDMLAPEAEVLLRGLQRPVQTTASPFPALYERFGNNHDVC